MYLSVVRGRSESRVERQRRESRLHRSVTPFTFRKKLRLCCIIGKTFLDERTFRAFLYTQMEMFNVGEEEAVDFEICDGKIFLCTDSGERHEIEQISDETKRVVVATIEKLAETVDVVENKSPQGNSASEQSSNAAQGETVTASTADGNSPDNNLDNKELDQTGMAMLVDLKARVAGKSTPKLKRQ
ncbi:unnamed protein product [Trichogramma brassicae]|uniref:Uncharacterized protein n=1 Tax=Trichogramma brassicae TaxID=86971 RepID=A0A6H5IWU5_9HYME|nr:unnamed protein product [Trichogramma brassicae]